MNAPPPNPPQQIAFRTLCNYLMITAGDVERALRMHPSFDPDQHPDQLSRLRRRGECAWRWITSYAPEDFRFTLATGSEPMPEMSTEEAAAVAALKREIDERFLEHDEKSMAEAIYRIADETGADRKRFFQVMYRILVNADRGPRLAGFLLTIGRDRLLEILAQY